MLRCIAQGRKGFALVISAAILAGGLTASTGAFAGPFGPKFGGPGFGGPKFGGPMYWQHPHPRYGYGYGSGFGGAALAGGLVLGALAANAAAAAASAPPPPPPTPANCKLVPKPQVDPYGNKYFTRVQVCS